MYHVSIHLKQASPIFTFANQAGLDMLETTPMELKDLSWEQTFDELTQKSFFSILNQVMQQVVLFSFLL